MRRPVGCNILCPYGGHVVCDYYVLCAHFSLFKVSYCSSRTCNLELRNTIQRSMLFFNLVGFTSTKYHKVISLYIYVFSFSFLKRQLQQQPTIFRVFYSTFVSSFVVSDWSPWTIITGSNFLPGCCKNLNDFCLNMTLTTERSEVSWQPRCCASLSSCSRVKWGEPSLF